MMSVRSTPAKFTGFVGDNRDDGIEYLSVTIRLISKAGFDRVDVGQCYVDRLC